MATSTVFVNKIIRHWRDNFPRQAAELEKSGQLLPAAQHAADKAGLVEEQARAKGLGWTETEELSVQEWGSPPGTTL